MDEKIHINCPGCSDASLDIINDEMTIPHFGDVIISTLICQKCGYRTSDVISVGSKEPNRYSIHVTRSENLSVRVIRSSTSVVIIPEMGVRIDPGIIQEGYITNVEGVLHRVLPILEQILQDISLDPGSFDDAEERISRTVTLIEWIKIVLEERMEPQYYFHLVLEDPTGNSAIVDENTAIEKELLTEKEVVELTGNIS